MPTVVEASRVRLRMWRATDRLPFAHINAHPEVMRFLPRSLDRRESDALADILERTILEDGIGFWALERKEDARFLGFLGIARLRGIDLGQPAAEFGWRLARDAWGQGYASEAARACLGYAPVRRDGRIVVGITAADNRRSRLLMERIGMSSWRRLTIEHPDLAIDHPLRTSVVYRAGGDATADTRAPAP